MTDRIDLRSLLPDELKDYLVSLGEKGFRAKQIFPRLHKGERVSEISSLSKALRERLEKETLDVSFPPIVRRNFSICSCPFFSELVP